jgi:hypothetical protein
MITEKLHSTLLSKEPIPKHAPKLRKNLSWQALFHPILFTPILLRQHEAPITISG